MSNPMFWERWCYQNCTTEFTLDPKSKHYTQQGGLQKLQEVYDEAVAAGVDAFSAKRAINRESQSGFKKV